MINTKKMKIILIMWVLYFCVLGLYVVNVEAQKISKEVKKEKVIQPIEKVRVKKPPIKYIKKVKPRYGFTFHEVYLLTQLLCGSGEIDGDGEYDIDYQKKVNHKEVNKVLCVVMNRVRSNSFPNTVEGVVLQKRQFDVMPRNLGRMPSMKAVNIVNQWCKKYDTYDKSIQTIPKSHLFYEGNGVINITRRNY